MTVATKDAYTWQVVHPDETTTPEFDESRPDGRGLLEVEKPIMAIQLLGATTKHSVVIPNGASPIFFRRRPTIAFQGTDEIDLSVAHCIGWKKSEDAQYLFVSDNGCTLLTSDFNAV